MNVAGAHVHSSQGKSPTPALNDSPEFTALVEPHLFYFIRFTNSWQGQHNSMTPVTAGP